MQMTDASEEPTPRQQQQHQTATPSSAASSPVDYPTGRPLPISHYAADVAHSNRTRSISLSSSQRRRQHKMNASSNSAGGPAKAKPLDVYSLHPGGSSGSNSSSNNSNRGQYSQSLSPQPLYEHHQQSLSPDGTMRGTKRRAMMVDDNNDADDILTRNSGTSMLSTLANISVERMASNSRATKPITPKPRHDNTLKAYSLSANRRNYVSRALAFDSQTNMPPADIAAELLSHVDREFNVVSKLLQPKNFRAEYGKGKIGSFLVLSVMANNVIYSTHPAITSIGFVRAEKAFIDKAKLYVGDAIENPSVHNCISLLLLGIAYTHQGQLEVSSHYSSMSLKLLQQMDAYKIDDNVWSDENTIISESWLEREEVRRLIWGSFTVDTFLSLMLHRAPYVAVDLSGVNKPCAPHMWYIGNENFEALSFPKDAFGVTPDDTEYLARVKEMKMEGLQLQINGATMQVNFAVLGNAILRNIHDPNVVLQEADKLVVDVYKSLTDWMNAIPKLPANPSYMEVQHTLLMSSAAMCIKSVTTPYLITRSQDPVAPLSDDLSVTINGSDVGELKDTDTLDTIFLDYVKNACTVYKYTRLTGDVMKNDIPPMFISYSVVICGGIFASIAYAAPTKQLRETFRGYAELMKKLCRDFSHKTLLFADALKDIEKVEEMVRFLPRRLSVDQLLRIRKILIPSSIESLVGKKFCSFIDPIRRIAQLPHSVSNNSSMDWLSSLSSPSPSLSEKHLSPSSNMSHLASLPRSPSPLNLNGNNSSCSANTAGRSGNGSSSSNGGGIPLTSNLCAIFGRHMHHHYHHQAIFGGSGIKRTGTNSSADSADINSVDDELFPGSYKGQQPPRALDGSCKMPKAAKLPDYKLTFISISSLFVALTIATKDEPFFEAAMDDMAYDIRSPFIDNNSPPKMEQDDNQLGIQMDAVHSSNSDKMDEDSDQKSVDSSLRSRSCLFTRIWQGVSSVAATYNNARNDVPSSPLSHGSGEKSSWLSHRVDAMRIQSDTPSVNKNADMGGSLQQQQQQQQQNSIKSSLSDLLN